MIGTRVAHYEIRSRIGAGGMGEVYRAFDTKLEREVALKILPAQMARDPDRRQRFLREAKAVAALRHAHIVTIYSVEEADECTFLTMELLEGHTLAELKPAGGFPLGNFLEIAIPIAEAVGHAHAKGVLHRDLKPANVMLEHDRHVKVLDFGLAKIMTPPVEGSTATVGALNLTGEGRVLGTASYMSPEQAEGKPTDARSDVFSLGILMYEMITGERPFKGTNDISTLSSILRDTPPPVTEIRRELPRHLGRIIRRCLEKDPDRRYESAHSLALELETVREELLSGLAPEPSDPGRIIPFPVPPGAPTASPASGSGPGGPSTPWPRPNTPLPGSIPPVSAPPAARTSRRRGRLIGASLAIVIVVAGVVLTHRALHRPSTIAGAPGEIVTPVVANPGRPTIVVFPFENLGPAQDAYFAAGVTDEIMSRLGSVQGLAVLSRTTATQYDRKGKTMQQVVADLGVQYVLDGTVRWEQLPGGASRVRVSPQLVRAGDDTQIWANSYDRGIDEIFRVQSEIATEVVDKLGVALLGGERAALEKAPTQNVEAYQAYLRGKDGMDQFTEQEVVLRDCIRMFERAVELDPGFALAYAQLAKAYSGLCHYEWERSDAVLAKAKAAADKAMELAPQSPWGHVALGYYYYWGLKEFDKAEAEFTAADRLLPNQVEVLEAHAFVDRRRLAFAEAERLLEQAVKLDPRNVTIWASLGETQTILGQRAAGNASCDRAIELAPNSAPPYLNKATSAMLAGDAGAAEKILAAMPSSLDAAYMANVAYVHFNARRFDLALKQSADLSDLRAGQFHMVCRPLMRGQILAAQNQPEPARQEFESARALLAARLQAKPDDANAASALALTDAYLGRKADADREAARALDLFPARQDKWIRLHRLFDQARVEILNGESAAAIAGLESLLKVPNDCVSPAFLRISPLFDPLRNNPRFLRLLAAQ